MGDEPAGVCSVSVGCHGTISRASGVRRVLALVVYATRGAKANKKEIKVLAWGVSAVVIRR